MEGVMIMNAKPYGEGCNKMMKELECTAADSHDDIASEIAQNLQESNEFLVLEVVSKLGFDKASEYYQKVKNIEKSGGLLTSDGLRRRTPGGVFFYLVNTDSNIDNEIKKEIFHDTYRAKSKMKSQAIKEMRKKKNEELKELLVKEGLLSVQQPQ